MQTAANDRDSDSVSSISGLSDTSDDEEQEKTVTKKKRSSKKTSGNKSSTKVGVMQFVCIFFQLGDAKRFQVFKVLRSQ